jgi:glycosyltransferase involved in cell wall biosynthesis
MQAFVRHLPTFGWQSTVVTQAVEDMDVIDSSELARLPGSTDVHRVSSPDPFRLRRRLSGIAPRDVARAAHGPIRPTLSPAPAHTSARRFALARGLSSRLKALVQHYWYVPDPLMPWAGRAAAAARALADRKTYDVLMSSCPSFSTHVAALRVKKTTGLPWVADFRDLWVGRPYRTVPSPRHAAADRRLEAAVVEHADHIILASPGWRATFVERYGVDIEDRLSVITNGFEAFPASPLEPPVGADRAIVFVHTGAMYASESPEPFLRALIELCGSDAALAQRVNIRLIGYGGDELPKLQALIAGTPIEPRVTYLGVRPNFECLQEQSRADVLLLLSGSKHLDTIRGKSFEYLAAGKPILALVPRNGVQAELLRRAGTAMIVEHGDIEGTKRAILELLDESARRRLQPNHGYIAQFERRALTAKLAGILNVCRTQSGD